VPPAAVDPAVVVTGDAESGQPVAAEADPAADLETTTPLLPQATAFLAALPLTAVVARDLDVVVAATTEATAVTAAAVQATGAPNGTAPSSVDTAPAPAAPTAPTIQAGPAVSTTSLPATTAPVASTPAAATAPHASTAPAVDATQTPMTAPVSGEVASPPDPSAGPPAATAPSRQQEAPSDSTLPATASQPAAASSGVAPPAAAGAVAGPVGPATDPVATTPAVTRQVFPEITRLVSHGNGTHRIRLQLEPEALGDVRVVLTIRNGAVDVRLAAGEDAQRALREGAPELRRLLELAGASDTRIVVRDLSSGSVPGNGTGTGLTGQWNDGLGRGSAGDAWSGGDRSQHQHAGTRGGSNAREGTNDGALPHRPVQPATRTRTSGVDVSM
jgi:flagellar hook-length control protein FliK